MFEIIFTSLSYLAWLLLKRLQGYSLTFCGKLENDENGNSFRFPKMLCTCGIYVLA